MSHDTEMTRQGERTPDPGVTPVGRVTWLQMCLFFDKTPEFVDLHLRWMHVPDEVAMDGGALLPGQISTSEVRHQLYSV